MGVIHRDLKTRNILVERVGGKKKGEKVKYTAIICDFGLARVVSETRVLHCEVVRGLSPKYTAPEAFIRFRSEKEGSGEEAKKVFGDFRLSLSCFQLIKISFLSFF